MSLQSLVSDIKKKKTGSVDLSFMKNQPKAGMSMRPLPGATISKAPETRAPFTRIAEKVLPRKAFNQYEEMVAEPLAKVRKFIAPSFSDQMNTALKENPKATQKQLEERAKQLDEESGMARLNNNTSLDIMGTGGSMKNIGRAIINKLTKETDRVTIAKTLKTEMPDHFTDVHTLANVSTKLSKVSDENEVQRIIDTVIKSKVPVQKAPKPEHVPETRTPDALTEEAKKYKSAEEFVKAQGGKYKTTINIQSKEDLTELRRILSDDAIADIKNGKMENWRGTPYEDLAQVNLVSFVPKTTAQELLGRIKPHTLKSNDMFHGTSPETAVKIKNEGFKVGSALDDDAFRGGGYDAKQNSISFSTDPMIASNFTGTGSRGALIKTTIKPNAKVVTVEGIDYAEDLNKYVKDLRKQGIDAVYLEGEKEIAIINKAVIDKISDVKEFDVFNKKSQLTDIYNKAHTSEKKLTPIDQLIAENKVRVVSRNGKDTYQVKQGDTWITKRDEDSAVKAFEPKPKKPGIQVDPTLEERLLSARIAKEMLQENPIKELSKYVAKRGEFKGELGEATGKKAKSTIGHGYGLDQKVMDLGIDDTETARKQYAQYRERIADNEVEIAEARDAVKQARQSEKERLAEEKAKDALIDPRYTESGISPKEARSLEETANQLVEDLPLSPSEKPMSLKEIVTQTPLKGKVNLLDYIRTPDRVLKKIGFEKEAQFLRNQYEEYVKELPKNIDKITAWADQVPKDAGERIFQWLDGKEVQLYGNELKVAGEIKVYLKEWADRLNLPEDNRVTNYITHLFEDQLVAKEFDEDLAKIIANKIPGEVYDPFLLRRLGAQGYKQDVWASLDAYVKRATRKVHLDPALEKMQDKAGASLEYSNLEKSQFDYIKNYIDRVNLRPTDLDSLLDTGFKQIFGYSLGQRPINRLTGLMRRLTYRGMLGLNLGSALRNLSQGVNTYATLGERDTFLGYAKLFSKENRDELEREGVLANNFIQDRALSSTKKLIEKADKGLWVFFDTAEKLNRGSAYLGAKTKGLRKGMTEKEAIQYAKNIVRKTQFNYDPVDTPVGLSSDLIKTLMQFQTYTTKQTEFLAELAHDRNFAGLARYALSGLAFVYTIGQAFGMEPKELLPVYRFDTPPSLKFPAELTKALFDAPDKYGNDRDFEQKTKDVAKTLWGVIPGGMQLKKTVQGLEANQEGGSYDASGKKQFEVGGSTLKETQSALFGKYASKEAKDYFDKGTGDKTFDTLKEKDNTVKADQRKRVKEEVDDLRGADKAEVKARLLELAREDKDVAEKVLDGLIEEKQNISSFEKKLKEASVDVRAEYVAEKLAELDTKEEKKQYILDLTGKGIMTESVLDRLIELKGETP